MSKKPDVPDWKMQRAFEAFCKQYEMVGVALLMRPVEAHQSAPLVECAHSSGDERMRSTEFAAGMVQAVNKSSTLLRPHRTVGVRE